MLFRSARVSQGTTAAAVTLVVSFASANATAQEIPQEVEVLGGITATFDGVERNWLTFHFPQNGGRAAQASASWSSFDTSLIPGSPGLSDMGIDLDALSDEERAYFEMMQAQLAERQAAILAHLAAEVEISISAHDPENPSLLTEGVLILSPRGLVVTKQDWDGLIGEPVDAAITYVVRSEGGIPASFYTSDADDAAQIVFDTLDFGTPFGMATGTFMGSLCRVDMRLGQMPTEDTDDCRDIAGSFETELLAEME